MRPAVLTVVFCATAYRSVASNVQASGASLTHCRASVIIWQP